MALTDEELDWALCRLGTSDVAVQNKSFAIVRDHLKQLQSHRARCIVPGDVVEDVLQDVAVKFWQTRTRFEHRGLLKWRALMKLMVHQACIDWVQRNREEQIDEGLEISVRDAPAGSSEFIDKLCGEVWFGYSKDLSLSQRNKRVLTVQLTHAGELDWDEVWETVHCRDATPRDRETIEDWLCDPAVSRDVAFRALYSTGAELVKELLGLPEPADLFDTAARALRREPLEEASTAWSYSEVVAIVWRFGFDFLKAQILARDDNSLKKSDLDDLCVRCEALFTFSNRMLRLLELFGDRSPTIFARQVVLKRLAYEYCYRSELPQRDILARMVGPARLTGYNLTASTLNAWLSAGRLIEELRGGVLTHE